MGIERVGIVGGGQMGAGIAEVCIKAGVDVFVHEINDDLAAAARSRVEKSLGRAVEKGKLDETGRNEALSLLRTGSDLDAMADRDLVVEAVIEDEGIKKALFEDLDRIVESTSAILASNTRRHDRKPSSGCTSSTRHQ